MVPTRKIVGTLNNNSRWEIIQTIKFKTIFFLEEKEKNWCKLEKAIKRKLRVEVESLK
jgi:hypothetical protein